MPMTRPTAELRQFARQLRARQTDCEWLIWQKLRARQLLDLKFRRQHPCPPYVIDFYVLSYNWPSSWMAVSISQLSNRFMTGVEACIWQGLELSCCGLITARFYRRWAGFCRRYGLNRSSYSRAPHPNPLPEGEGADWGIFENIGGLQAIKENPASTRSVPSPSGRGLG